MGSICAGIRGWLCGIFSRFRSSCFRGFPYLFCHGFLPLSPESGFCLAPGRCEGTRSIRQGFSGCLLRQIGGTFVGSLLITGALLLPLPLKYRAECALFCRYFGNLPFPGRVLPGFYLVVFLSLPDIRYCQHLPNGNLSQAGTDFDASHHAFTVDHIPIPAPGTIGMAGEQRYQVTARLNQDFVNRIRFYDLDFGDGIAQGFP